MTTVYGPDVAWPGHPKPHWQKPLHDARTAGWTLRYVGHGHTFGWLKCPAGECVFKADGTAKGAESVAIDAAKKVRNCPHGETDARPKYKITYDVCMGKLATLRTILEAAEKRIDAIEDFQAGWDRIAQLEGRLDELEVARLEIQLESASLTLEEIAAEIETVRSELDQESDHVLSADPAPSASGIDERLAEARDKLDDVEAAAKRLRAGHRALADEVSCGADEARSWLDDLQARFRTAQEQP